MPPALNLALFGDLHGRVLLPFFLARRWEEEHGERIDAALCVGDVGVYRGFDAMEKVSQRWARRHPEELGFSTRLLPRGVDGRVAADPVAAELLAATRCSLYFVPGNHEEHPYLDELFARHAGAVDQPVAVDRDWDGLAAGLYAEGEDAGHGRLLCLPQGRVVELPGPPFIAEPPQEASRATWEPAWSLALLAVNGLAGHTPAGAWRGPSRRVDLLLTHETYAGRISVLEPAGHRDAAGSEELRELIERVGPRYHFFGHHHRYFEEVELPAAGRLTRSIGLAQVFFADHRARLTPGCFGVLRVGGAEEMGFGIVEDGWIKALRYADCAAYL